MKKIPLLLFTLCIVNSTFSQAPVWSWADSPSGSGEIVSHAVATDASGNAYIGGYYYATDATFGNNTLPFTSDGDYFVVKYDAAGNVLWARSAGGIGFDEIRSITTDAGGGVYVTGIFDSPQLVIGNDTLTNSGGTPLDLFLAKYDSSGSIIWARGAVGLDRDFAESVKTDFAGHIYVAGSFEGPTITFDNVTLTNSAPGTEDVFLAKFDPAGNIIWAKSGAGNDLEWGISVTTDPYGNVLIGGPSQSDSITFDGITLMNPQSGYEQMFIVKYDSAGNVLWGNTIFSNNNFNELYSMSADAFGNILAVGTVSGDTAIAGANSFSNPQSGYFDMVVVKYNSSGTILWTKKVGGTDSDYGYAVSTDASGNAYVAGYFSSDTLYADSASSIPIDQYYYSDLFVIKYDENGDVVWTKGTGGIYQQIGYGYPEIGIAVSDSGDVFTVGCFYYDSVAFDSDTVLLSGNFTNVVLAKASDAGACAATFTIYPDSVTPHLYWAVNQATGTAPITWLWNWGDGNTDTTPYPSHTYTTGGFYPICLTIADSTGCTNSVCHTSQLLRLANSSELNVMVQINVVSSIPVHSGPVSVSKDVKVYPNPATEYIQLPVTHLKEYPEVYLFSVDGKKILTEADLIQGRLEIKYLPQGIYFLQINYSGNVYRTKFVKQ